jgi:hypothetical protein
VVLSGLVVQVGVQDLWLCVWVNVWLGYEAVGKRPEQGCGVWF